VKPVETFGSRIDVQDLICAPCASACHVHRICSLCFYAYFCYAGQQLLVVCGCITSPTMHMVNFFNNSD
jgi:hypothetical protein